MRKKTVIIITVLTANIFTLAGCSSSQTIIKERKVEITVPEIRDTIRAEYKEMPKGKLEEIEELFEDLPDSARMEGEKEIATKSGKVKARVTYYPKRKIIELDVEEHRVDTIITDTTKITEKKATTTAEKFGYGAMGVIAFIGLIILGTAIAIAIKFNLIKL